MNILTLLFTAVVCAAVIVSIAYLAYTRGRQGGIRDGSEWTIQLIREAYRSIREEEGESGHRHTNR